jgi:flagellar biosynthesis protein FlhG
MHMDRVARMNPSRDTGRPVQVIAVTGGKGGVGKSSVAINLGIGLSARGRRVVILDADLGLANLDVLLGLRAKRNLADVIAGECGLADIMLDGPCGVRIIPASSGTQSMVSLSRAEHAGLIHALSDIADRMDELIVDTAAGISDSVVSFVRAAHECLVVVCNEPSSIADSYALMKLLHKEYGMHRFRVLPNMVRSPQEGSALFHKLEQVCERFLDVMLVQAGNIPYDDTVRKCIQRQRAVLDAAPRSKAAAAFRELAERRDALPVSASASGHLEFFVERLLGGAAAG